MCFVRLYDKVSYKTYAIALTLFSFAVGNYGLAAIIQGAVPVLVLLYPLTMVLILLGFLNNFFGGKKVVYVCTVLFTGLFSLYSTVASTFKLAVPAVDNVLAKVNFLPVPADFAWLNYALVGFVLGIVLSFFVKENK